MILDCNSKGIIKLLRLKRIWLLFIALKAMSLVNLNPYKFYLIIKIKLNKINPKIEIKEKNIESFIFLFIKFKL